jgi:hypothetical protein
MAGDKGGWLRALWVPVVGVVMSLAIWVCDRLLVTEAPHRRWSRDASSLLFTCSSLCPRTLLPRDTELVSLSPHQSASEEMETKSHLIL